MNVEHGDIIIILIDRDGCNLALCCRDDLRTAKRHARNLVDDPEYIGLAGKASVYAENGEVLFECYPKILTRKEPRR